MPAEVRHLALPPHSVEAEQSVLGSVMFDPKAMALIAGKIATPDFYRRDHQLIFDAIRKVQAEGMDPDAVTVGEYLDRTGKADQTGGLIYLAELVRNTPSSSNVEAYAAVVTERAAMRRLQQLGERVIQATVDGSVESSTDLISNIESHLQTIRGRTRVGRGLVCAKDLVGELVDDLERRREGPRGLRIGLSDFDELTTGLEPGDLVVMAGRPGMGKTAWLVSTADMTSRQTDVAIFSAEMSSQQLMRRALSNRTSIAQGKLRSAEKLDSVDWVAINNGITELRSRRLHIDDTPSPSLSHIRAESMALKARAPLGLVLVDYIQLVKGEGKNRYEELRDVAYGMKNLAKELHAPVILLAQLNRSVESRENKRPNLSDLRDSGAIEEAADVIGLLYSEGYYHAEFSMPYVLECMLAKVRNGERGECLWHFSGAYSRVEVLADGAKSQYRQQRAKQQQRRGRRDEDDDL